VLKYLLFPLKILLFLLFPFHFRLSLFSCYLWIATPLHTQAQETLSNDSTKSAVIARFLAQMIQYKSISGGEGEFGRFLADYCRKQGLYVEIFTDKDYQYNFAASLYPLTYKKPNIVLQSHLDVVPAGNVVFWEQPPFAGKIVKDTVWGRGAIDCKGLIAMQLFALQHFIALARQSDLPYNITFLAVSGEETGGKEGAEIIVNQYWEGLNAVVVFGEGGSGLQNIVPSKPNKVVFGVSIAEKSSLWLKVTAQGRRNGHGAVPPSLYATKRLLRGLINIMNDRQRPRFSSVTKRMFKQFGWLEGGVKGFVIRHAHRQFFRWLMRKYFAEGENFYPLVYNTITITGLSSNQLAFNQIANKAEAVLDCRLLPGTDIDKFLKKIKNKLGNRVEITILDQSPASPPTQTDKFYDGMEEALHTVFPDCAVIPILFPATTDNNFFRQKNVPTYGIQPTLFTQEILETTHNLNERVTITSLLKGVETFTVFLDKILKTRE
jgi:acetylornithine deacetylase/succinyl-diaminopimelate desuccinylase-like protein